MKRLIFFLLPFIISQGSVFQIFSQVGHGISWYGELHAGFQATLNDHSYTAQIKSGYEGIPFDSSEHYAAYFKNQIPVEALLGMDNGKGFQFQIQLGYYGARMALSNPPQLPSNTAYQFGRVAILAGNVSALIDFGALSAATGTRQRIHFLSGISTGLSMPISFQMNQATAKHFGIGSFQSNLTWTAGLDFRLNVDISRRFYIANAAGLSFALAGNTGKLLMQANSQYIATDPIKTDIFIISTGIGFHLY